MKTAIIGRVAKTKEGKARVTLTATGAVVNLYCGTQYNKDANAPKVHLNVAVWFSYATDAVKALQGDDVIFCTGELSTSSKDGESSLRLQSEDNNIFTVNEKAVAGWGIYPYYQELAYINGVFKSKNDAINVNFRTNYYRPYYKSVQGSALYERVKNTKSDQLKYYVPKDSAAMKTIHAALTKLTGKESNFSEDDYNLLKNYYCVIIDSFQSVSEKASEGKNPSFYLNNVLQRLLIVNQYEKEKSDSGIKQQTATPPPQFDDIPFGMPSEDDPAFNAGYDSNIKF